MFDKGTIVQQLEDERNHLVAKIQKMQALLERWVAITAVDESEMDEAATNEFLGVVDDTRALLKEAKEVKHGN